MASITVFGRLGADPVQATRKDGSLATDKNGNPIVNFSLAEPNSRDRDKTNWHQCAVYGMQAAMILQSCQKGDRLLIEGQVDSEMWVDKSTNPRTSWKVTVSRFTFVEPKRDSIERVSAPFVDKAPTLEEQPF